MRTQADIVRTTFWYRYLSKETKQDSPFKLGRYIEPEKYSIQPCGGTRHTNKFPNFEIGKHTPHSKLVNRAEIIAPGSANVLIMPLWQTLQPNFGVKQIYAVIKRLPGDVTAKVNGFDRFTADGVFPEYKETSGRKIVRMGSYDALCMLMIYWRSDNNGMEHPKRMEIAHDIYHLLLILSGELIYYRQCESIFALFKRQVFDHACLNGYQFNLDYEKFSRNAEWLNRLYPFERNGKPTQVKKRNLAIGMTLQKASKNFKLNAILNDIFDYDQTAQFFDKNVIHKLTYNRLCADWASNVQFENDKVSLIDTIKNHVKNDLILTESDEQVLIMMARFYSRQKNI